MKQLIIHVPGHTRVYVLDLVFIAYCYSV